MAALARDCGWSLRHTDPAGSVGCVPGMAFSGWNVLPRHGQRRGSEVARRPAKERILESRVSGDSGVDDGGGPAALAVELRAVYVLNWLIFLFATGCFSVLLITFLQWLRRNSWPELGWDASLGKALVCFGYAFFLLSNMNQTLWYITPDMLVQGLVYLSAACGLRLFLPDSSWKHSLTLGLALGLGYLAKAAMFPAALLLIGILFLRPPKDSLGRRHSVIALACFCLLAAPLVLSLSQRETPLHFWRFRQIELRLVRRRHTILLWMERTARGERDTGARSAHDQPVSPGARISQPGRRHPADLVRSVLLVGGPSRPD